MLGRWDEALEARTRSSPSARQDRRTRSSRSMRDIRAAISLARGRLGRCARATTLAVARARARDEDEPDHTLALARVCSRRLHAELGQCRRSARARRARCSPIVREIGPHGALTRLGPFADELGIADELALPSIAEPARSSAVVARASIEPSSRASSTRRAADIIAATGNPTHRGANAPSAGEHLLWRRANAPKARSSSRRRSRSTARSARRSTSRASRARSPGLRASRRRRARSGRSCRRCSRRSRRRRRRARRDGRRSAGSTSCARSCSGRGLRPEVDPLEHERAQREHRLPHLGRLADVVDALGRLDDVVHEPVDPRRSRWRRERRSPRAEGRLRSRSP